MATLTMTADGAAPTLAASPFPKAALRRAAADLIASGSLEIGAHRPEDAAAAAELLPSGTPVFVNHLPRHALADTLTGLLAVRKAGLEPVPHMAARRITSREEARAFLKRACGEAGVRKVLVLGGDTRDAAGPYKDANALIEDGMLAEAGIREIGIAAYPEGHPRIPSADLDRGFAAKMASIARQGHGPFAMTQFTFAPLRTVALCTKLARRYPQLAVYAGVPGPTKLLTLIAYAQKCGVGASLRAVQSHGLGSLKMITKSDPSDQILTIAQHGLTNATPNIVGIHTFTFGGVRPSAEFMNHWITSRG